jgi:hypothetical protein
MLYGTTLLGGGAGWGTAYRIAKDGSGFQTLVQMNGVQTGSEPHRSLLEASDGWFYGVAPLNGWNGYSAGYGTIFRFLPNGTFQVVHPFSSSGPEPSHTPNGGLLEAAPGRFFGVARGGALGMGVLYELSVVGSPAFRTLFTFGGDRGQGIGPMGALALGPDGLAYGTANAGGAHEKGAVFRVRRDGSGYEVVHSFNGTDGRGPDGLQTGSDGDLYGFTSMGGPRGGGGVYRLCFPPGVGVGGPYSVPEGASLTVAATLTGRKRVSYAWDLDGDGSPDAEGAEVVFSAASQDGPSNRTILARVTDDCGLTGEATAVVDITNVAPVVIAGPDVVLGPGEEFATSGGFEDPGPDSWMATVDYGDGTGPQALALSGRSFALAHRYARAGTYTVTVAVADDDGGTGSGSLVVTVETVESTIEGLIRRVEELVASGDLSRIQGFSLVAKLRAALWLLQLPNGEGPAALALVLFAEEVEFYVRTGVLGPEEGGPLAEAARRIAAQLWASRPAAGRAVRRT